MIVTKYLMMLLKFLRLESLSITLFQNPNQTYLKTKFLIRKKIWKKFEKIKIQINQQKILITQEILADTLVNRN